jgi:hypothetical protein
MNTSLTLLFDLILIGASSCAAVYCWLLNKRLQLLRDTNQGLGATIKEMAISVTRAQEAVKDIKTETKTAKKELNLLLVEAQATIEHLSDLSTQQINTETLPQRETRAKAEPRSKAETRVKAEIHDEIDIDSEEILRFLAAEKSLETVEDSAEEEEFSSAKFDYYRKKLEEITKQKVKKLQDEANRSQKRTFTRLVNRIEA